jgi:CheY-like chemotaxis protein
MKSVTDNMQMNADAKKLALQFEFKGDRKMNVTGDVMRLKQILLNLLSNAIKYTDKGFVKLTGELIIENNKPFIKFAVADSGKGIPKSQQSKLFSKYFQATSANSSTGTGLGLYICSKLVQLQKGKIGIESEPGKGTTFFIDIPYATSVSQKELSKTALTPAVNASVFADKSIMVVDDNKLNLQLYEIIMSEWKVKLWPIPNAAKALDILKTQNVDLVITDMSMDVMDGKEFTKQIKKLKPLLPVMLVTGYKYTDKEMNELKKDGFSEIMHKPFNKVQLSQKMNAVL